MEHILLPEKYPGYLERFTKAEYGYSFRKYCGETESFFAQLELEPDTIPQAVKDFLAAAESSLPRLFGRKLAIYDISRFLFIYTVPAAQELGGEAGRRFADALIAEWNGRYPDAILNKAAFSEINSGFKTRIMGFDVRE